MRRPNIWGTCIVRRSMNCGSPRAPARNIPRSWPSASGKACSRNSSPRTTPSTPAFTARSTSIAERSRTFFTPACKARPRIREPIKRCGPSPTPDSCRACAATANVSRSCNCSAASRGSIHRFAPTLSFQSRLRALSHSVNARKPSDRLFQHALDALAERGIEPHEVLHVGSGLARDIVPAKKVAPIRALMVPKGCSTVSRR